MKKNKLLSSILYVACLLTLIGSAHAQNLLSNGNFQSNPIGTSASLVNGGIDTGTFTDWRFFSVGSPAINTFNGGIVNAGAYTNGTAGARAFRFDVIHTGGVGSDFALDRDAARVSISANTQYILSFNLLAWGAAMEFRSTVAEFNSGGNFLGATDFSLNPPNSEAAGFQSYSFNFSTANPNTTQVNIGFRPIAPGAQYAAVLSDVSFSQIPEPGTISMLAVAGTIGTCLLRKRRNV